MKAISRLGTIAVLLLTTLLMSGTAHAIIVTVDGVDDGVEWVGAASSADANEAGILDNTVDISTAFFTNSSNFIYWRVDTYAPGAWNTSNIVLWLCMDTDNSIATGQTIANCAGQQGVDYVFLIRGRTTGNPRFDPLEGSQRCNGTTCADIPIAEFGTSVIARSGAITEIGLNRSLFTTNFPTVGSCTNPGDCPIPTAVYLDGGTVDPDDNNPDSGTFTPNIPGPTPVTLTSFTATAGGAGVDLAWATASELNVLGYNIYRGSSDDRTAATKISPSLIAATGDGVSGASYSWADSSASAGTIYRYWLEVVDTDGTTEEYGPVALAPEVAALSPRLYLPLIQR